MEFWDDELQRLSARVIELFGEEALGEALQRSFTQVPKRPVPCDSFAAEILPAEALTDETTTFAIAHEFANVLKMELRRRVTPQ